MNQRIEQLKDDHIKEKSDYDAKIRALEQKLEQQSTLNIVPIIDEKADTKSTYQVPPGYEGLGITEMFAKTLSLEKELIEERKKSSEFKLHLDHIREEVEAKKPIIASQRRDYNRIVESYALMNKQNDELLAETGKLKRSLDEATDKIKELTDAIICQEKVSDVLSLQLQNILKQKFASDTPSKSVAVISDLNDEFLNDRLVTFDSIEDLQKKNEVIAFIILLFFYLLSLLSRYIYEQSRSLKLRKKDTSLIIMVVLILEGVTTS
jgi:hypothetical protein